METLYARYSSYSVYTLYMQKYWIANIILRRDGWTKAYL